MKPEEAEQKSNKDDVEMVPQEEEAGGVFEPLF